MATIWVKGKSKIFHLAGKYLSDPGDFEEADRAITAASITRETSTILRWTHAGVLYRFDINPPGRSGECRRCGRCCSHSRLACPALRGKCDFLDRGKNHICEYLIEYPEKGGIGHAGGTACRIHDDLLSEDFKACVIYPNRPEDLLAGCGIRFNNGD